MADSLAVYAEWCDFNGAGEYFAGPGADEWADIEDIVDRMVPCFQASDQAGIKGAPIFDPKATNLVLTTEASRRGWRSVPVPERLRAFGDDWDAGKRCTLAEWQFSNYPFLWNNVIRTEAVFKQGIPLRGVHRTEALLVVTKSGVFPSSNSSLYYEQAKAQLEVVTVLDVFDVPIRLVGLGVEPATSTLPVWWATYEGRTSRTVLHTEEAVLALTWNGRSSKYGTARAAFRRV